MPVYIHDIATSVPEGSNSQDSVREIMKSALAKDRKTQAILHRIYSQSGIEKRHSVINEFHQTEKENPYLNGSVASTPTTGERNEVYKTSASSLFVETGKKLLENNPQFQKNDITHVITVSCTGFYAPGPDYDLVRHLGLLPSTERFHLGFMGCFAAFPALKMAHSFCQNNPDAVILIIATELCSLHFQQKTDLDNLISASVFADGSAGVLVSQKKPPKLSYEIQGFASSLTPNGEKDMAWDIGDHGFDMILSTYVPDIIESNLKRVIQPLFDKYDLQLSDIDYWAIHPGGRAIVDKIESGLNLKEHQVAASRKTLAQYGNMSSVTVLFVLHELMNSNPEENSTVLSMAFGPGLTIESGLLKVV
ncbi:MAG: type III polyketide synthase [Balneola sp.]